MILGRANEDYDSEAKELLTDDNNPLSKWQDEDAPHFWKCEFINLIFPPKSLSPRMSGSLIILTLISLNDDLDVQAFIVQCILPLLLMGVSLII